MEGRLAESGSGPVYRARDASGRSVAIKVLEGPLVDISDPELPDRLRAEADLRHDNILPILDLFQNSVRIGVVMEFLEGKTLREIEESASLEERIEIMTRAGEALRYANANGVTHHDLKPSRVHVLADGTVKVRGFSVDSAPQQPVDLLSNIFSYGEVLDELTADCEERPELLESIIERATDPDRDLRYQSFDELLADVARLLLQLRKTDLHFSGLFEAVAEKPREDVQLAIQPPGPIRPGEWQTLVAEARLSENAGNAPEGELTFVPEMNGVEFNPRRVSFQWEESVHHASFRLRASAGLDGQTAHGEMCVYSGSIVVAQVPFAIEVRSAIAEPPAIAMAAAAAAGARMSPAIAAPPPLPPAPSIPVWTPPRARPFDPEPEPRRLGMQWAAAILIVFGIGGLSWYAFQSRKPAPIPAAVTVASPVPDPAPDPDPAPVTPTLVVTAKPAPVATKFTLALWSRGGRINTGQTVRGGDPFLQASFNVEGKVSSEASLRVDWFVNGVLSGATEFDPSEKGKHKAFPSQPPEGEYRAVLMVDGDEAAGARFSYRK
jgi:Protein kinase domain